MKLIKIRILEFKEKPFVRLQSTAELLADCDNREAAAHAEIGHIASLQKIVKTAERAAQLEALVEQLVDIGRVRKSALDGELRLAQAAGTAAKTHKLVGTFGYQIVNGKMEVEREVDERGDPFPIGATYCSEVADINPPAPIWFAQ